MESFSPHRGRDSFTLVELLVVIGILAILTAAVVVVLNPAELLKQSRDSKRVTDLAAVNNAIKLLLTQVPDVNLGNASTVYFSLPAANSDCSDIVSSLPQVPAGWSYRCTTAANLTKTDGSGWLPVNFSSTGGVASLPALPIDPSNTANNYYMYTSRGGLWEINTRVESLKYGLAEASDKISTDGGDDFVRYEVGSNLALLPWNFEFSALAAAAHGSNKPGWYREAGSGTESTQSDVSASSYDRFNGYAWLIWQENIPFDPNATYKISCRVRQVTEPTNANKYIYCGFAGVASDGVTLLNRTGADTYSSQHYQVVNGAFLVAGSGWIEFVGYTKGLSSGNGDSGGCSAATPCRAQKDVRFIRPLIIMNYSGGDGAADMDYFKIEKL
jgi:type II secretory pathway pseudopilin PulG